jgi:hypothetical protein
MKTSTAQESLDRRERIGARRQLRLSCSRGEDTPSLIGSDGAGLSV